MKNVLDNKMVNKKPSEHLGATSIEGMMLSIVRFLFFTAIIRLLSYFIQHVLQVESKFDVQVCVTHSDDCSRLTHQD